MVTSWISCHRQFTCHVQSNSHWEVFLPLRINQPSLHYKSNAIPIESSGWTHRDDLITRRKHFFYDNLKYWQTFYTLYNQQTYLRISVVIIRQAAVWLICTSPVINPTSLNVCLKSRYFWLDNALIGDVYTVLKYYKTFCVFM
jgi:hypothetical protein